MEKPHPDRPRRFQVSRRGQLSYEEHQFACLVQDISLKGLFVICNYDLEIGLELMIRFELEPGLPFEGKIKVRHFHDGCFGAELVEAEPSYLDNWNQFLIDEFGDQTTLPERRARR